MHLCVKCWAKQALARRVIKLQMQLLGDPKSKRRKLHDTREEMSQTLLWLQNTVKSPPTIKTTEWVDAEDIFIPDIWAGLPGGHGGGGRPMWGFSSSARSLWESASCGKGRRRGNRRHLPPPPWASAHHRISFLIYEEVAVILNCTATEIEMEQTSWT